MSINGVMVSWALLDLETSQKAHSVTNPIQRIVNTSFMPSASNQGQVVQRKIKMNFKKNSKYGYIGQLFNRIDRILDRKHNQDPLTEEEESYIDLLIRGAEVYTPKMLARIIADIRQNASDDTGLEEKKNTEH